MSQASASRPIEIDHGTAVHHPHHGIGRVQSIRTRNFAGASDTRFAQLYFQRENLTLILPAESLADNVRAPLDADQAQQLLDHLKDCAGKVRKQWKARAAAHQAAIDRGDPFEYATIYKGLAQLEADGTLRHTDRRHLNRSLDFLADELAYALGKTNDQARDLIQDAVDIAA